MEETADDLSTPLGRKTVRNKRRFRLPFTGIQALAVVLGLILVGFIGFAIFNDNPLGGEAVAHVSIRQTAPPAGDKSAAVPVTAPEPVVKSAAKQAAPGDQKTITIIDGSSGTRPDVVIGGP